MFSKHKLMQYLIEEKRLEEGGGLSRFAFPSQVNFVPVL